MRFSEQRKHTKKAKKLARKEAKEAQREKDRMITDTRRYRESR